MSKRLLWSLWGLAGLVTLLLVGLTVELTAVSTTDTGQRPTTSSSAEFEFTEEIVIEAGMPVYLVGDEIRVRTQPDPFADTINFLQPGDRVIIQVVQQAHGQPWYRIEAGRGRNGWIPDENVSINRPNETP